MMDFMFLGPPSVQTTSVEHRLLRKNTTHLAKIAIVLQKAPCKMLTFPQVTLSWSSEMIV